MKRPCTMEEGNLIRSCVADILTFPGLFNTSDAIDGKKFWVNGGTIMNYVTVNEEDAWLTIAEDDLQDSMGNYCCVHYPVCAGLEVKAGERILTVYNEDGAYIPLRTNKQTRQLIPMHNPEYFDAVDWDKSVKILHPAIWELDKKPYLMNEKEILEFAKKGAQFFPRLLRGLKEKQLKKVRYKKKVLYCYSHTDETLLCDNVWVLEHKNGKLEYCEYFTKNTNFLPKHISYGKVIYKYTKKEDVSYWGVNFFGVED